MGQTRLRHGLVGGASIVLAAPKRKQNEPRGARQVCAYLAPQPCIRLDLPEVRTMKQPCASVASSEAAGPFSRRRPSHAITRVATTSDRHQRPVVQARRGTETLVLLVIFAGRSRNNRAHAHTVRDFAGGDQSPHCDQQFAGEGHDHGGLANTVRPLGPRAIPLRQRAVLLEPKESPGELDQAAANAGIASPRG
jgi:hypothetical protein